MEIDRLIDLKVIDEEACPRYVLRMLKGVTICPSPYLIRERLIKCGMRPINSIVDVTNYVMLELGQPLHAFDYHRLEGKRIEVRLASSEIRFRTLDGVDRVIGADDLLICDGNAL
jgi:phenylalanyl-tRNA synthetase beta chain